MSGTGGGNPASNHPNKDIMAFVNGADGLDASQLARAYSLMAYQMVSKSTNIPDRVSKTFGKPSQMNNTFPNLEAPNRENSVQYVKDGFTSYYNNQSLADKTIDVQHLLDMMREACYKTFQGQVTTIYGNGVNDANLKSVFEEFTGTLEGATPLKNDSGKYITQYDAFMSKANADMFAIQVGAPKNTVIDQDGQTLLVYMLTPWISMKYLASFVPGPWNAADSQFHASYLDMQYATLALYKVMFDTLNHMQKYIETNNADSQTDVDALASIAMKITHTIDTVYVADRKEKYPQWQSQVSDRASATKQMSMDLFELNAQLERRKTNLVVMLQNQRQLRQEAARSRWKFWGTVAVYVALVAIMIGLLAGKQFRALYVFSGLVVVVPLLWLVISMVRGTLSHRK